MKYRLNVYLTQEHMERLRAINKKTGAPIAEVIRRALDEYLKKKEGSNT